MAHHLLDAKGKTIPKKGRTSRAPAQKTIRGVPHFLYEFHISIPQSERKYKQLRRRFWLPSDIAAEEKERELKNEPPVDALTWRKALDLWLEGNTDFTESHRKNAKATIDLWEKKFSARSTVEGTTLAAFSKWTEDLAKTGTGRSAQNRRANMLAIARWCRARGSVRAIPFEHAPKPLAKMNERKAAAEDVWALYLVKLPAAMKPLWKMLGYTGMRISAACSLRESDIAGDGFTVTTKFSEKVFYALTDELAEAIAEARAFKAKGRQKGRGKKKITLPMDTPYLFCNDSGNPWTKDTFNGKLRKVIKADGLPKITPHQLRHMNGTILAEENLSPDMIGAALGQKDRRSSEEYIDKTQVMRNAGLSKVADRLRNIQKSYKSDMKTQKVGASDSIAKPQNDSQEQLIICPHCSHKFIPSK